MQQQHIAGWAVIQNIGRQIAHNVQCAGYYIVLPAITIFKTTRTKLLLLCYCVRIICCAFT